MTTSDLTAPGIIFLTLHVSLNQDLEMISDATSVKQL